MQLPSDSPANLVIDQIAQHVPSTSLLLVGAECRNVLAASLGFNNPARSTKDVDIAVAIDNGESFQKLRAMYPPKSRAWQEINIAGIPIDLIPFGDVEIPAGTVTIEHEQTELNVAGFKEVLASSSHATTTRGTAFRMPTVPGLAALKIHAALDRIPQGKYKDAVDLASIISWYTELNRAYLNEYDHILSDPFFEFDPDALAAGALGHDVAQLLGPHQSAHLCQRFDTADPDVIRLFEIHLSEQDKPSKSPDLRHHILESFRHVFK